MARNRKKQKRQPHEIGSSSRFLHSPAPVAVQFTQCPPKPLQNKTAPHGPSLPPACTLTPESICLAEFATADAGKHASLSSPRSNQSHGSSAHFAASTRATVHAVCHCTGRRGVLAPFHKPTYQENDPSQRQPACATGKKKGAPRRLLSNTPAWPSASGESEVPVHNRTKQPRE